MPNKTPVPAAVQISDGAHSGMTLRREVAQASDMTHWFMKAGTNKRKQVPGETIGNMNGLSSGEHENGASSWQSGESCWMAGHCLPRLGPLQALGMTSHTLHVLFCPGSPLHFLTFPPVNQRDGNHENEKGESQRDTTLTGFLVIYPGLKQREI